MDPAAPKPPTPGDSLVRKTPWWSLSVGLHVLATLLVGFFWVVQAMRPESAAVVNPVWKTPPLPEMEKPRDLDPNKKILDMEKSVEDPVYRKDAEEADHNETADEEFQKARGDSIDYVSDKPFKGKATYDVVGGGAGGGGRFGSRLGGKRNLVARGGGGGDTEDSVLGALKWLSRHQNADGSWKTTAYLGECRQVPKYARGEDCRPNPGHEDYDGGNTALALLAFLGAGYSHLSKDTYDGACFGDVVRRGLQWMLSRQDADGCVGGRKADKSMYNHALSALALSEAYGLTGSALFKDQAQRAIDFTSAAQNPGKGWRYGYRSGDNDSSVTGWAVMALKSAEISGLSFPRSGYDGARAWFDEATDGTYGRVGYTHKGTGKVFVPGLNERFDHHETLTAIGIMSRIFMDRTKSDPRLSSGCDLLLRDKPAWNGNAVDFYYWYCASLALFQYDGPSGPKWRAWNQDMKKALVGHQNNDLLGCKAGSWEPVDRWSGEGGRVYGTAINALTLEVYYRYANVFGAADAGLAKGPAPAPAAPKPEGTVERENTMIFKDPGINPLVETSRETKSTFALDVDTASYTIARRYLNGNSLPPQEAVRVEEFLNYFRYDDPAPPEGFFGVRLEAAPSPFQADRHLLRVMVQAPTLKPKDRKDVVLTFVIDVSGSMEGEHRLGLVQRSLRFLLQQLRPTDRVGVIEYGSSARKLLDPTPLSRKGEILAVIDALRIEGSTNLEHGLDLGYELAAAHFDPKATNRVVACTDGVANNGATEPVELLKGVKDRASKGIWLSVLGFGMGNVNDALMEKLADSGNGNYAYIDDFAEAKKTFSEKLAGMLEVVAADAKVQVEFEARTVSGFRLLGYENRHVANRDFRNDKVDAGELGAGHQVTALYEISIKPEALGRLASVRLRYREPGTRQVVESEQSLGRGQVAVAAWSASPSYRLAAAVAQFAELLRGSPHAKGISFRRVLEEAEAAANALKRPADAVELLALIRRAEELSRN
jgi:Ca-activated chloride channel family protein